MADPIFAPNATTADAPADLGFIDDVPPPGGKEVLPEHAERPALSEERDGAELFCALRRLLSRMPQMPVKNHPGEITLDLDFPRGFETIMVALTGALQAPRQQGAYGTGFIKALAAHLLIHFQGGGHAVHDADGYLREYTYERDETRGPGEPGPDAADRNFLPSGGMAVDGTGRALDTPQELAHVINDELLDVVTLLHAAIGEASECHSDDRDDDNLTGSSSRAVSLIRMADDKVRRALHSMTPYV